MKTLTKSNQTPYLGSKHLLGILRTDEDKIYDVIETLGDSNLEIRELRNPKNILMHASCYLLYFNIVRYFSHPLKYFFILT